MRRLLKAKVGPVNLLAYAYAGSNPALPTILIQRKLRWLKTFSRLQRWRIDAAHGDRRHTEIDLLSGLIGAKGSLRGTGVAVGSTYWKPFLPIRCLLPAAQSAGHSWNLSAFPWSPLTSGFQQG